MPEKVGTEMAKKKSPRMRTYRGKRQFGDSSPKKHIPLRKGLGLAQNEEASQSLCGDVLSLGNSEGKMRRPSGPTATFAADLSGGTAQKRRILRATISKDSITIVGGE